jgi:predicted ATPase
VITRLAIAGYRSLRDVVLPLGQLNVVTGPNGSGKSSLYRGLRLLADVAQGRIIQSLAAEGGLNSTLWAGGGQKRKEPVALKLGFGGAEYGYAIDLGLPIPAESAFGRDPEIKAEALWNGETLRRSNVFALRQGRGVRLRDDAGVWRQAFHQLASTDTMMTHCNDPRDGAELLILREQMRTWRFYDHFRTDRDAPARRPQIGTYTPVLAGDGADLAAALQTIREIGDGEALQAAIADAFAGARVSVAVSRDGYFDLEMQQPGLFRSFKAAELSDGTLRYLLLVTALLSPRPPSLMILNEPETSLHPDLLAPLARLIAAAAEHTQLIVVTHASALALEIANASLCETFELAKELGETVVRGAERPAWTWPSR